MIISLAFGLIVSERSGTVVKLWLGVTLGDRKGCRVDRLIVPEQANELGNICITSET